MIQILQAGIMDTMQDMGRYGYQHLGINPGGAMDTVALAVANSLVGNEPGETAIELHFPASTLLFGNDILIALSGADFSATLNDEPIEINRPVFVMRESVLRFNSPVNGARCYLAVHGGFNLPEWLGSTGTNLKATAGGMEGRRLQRHDRLHFKQRTWRWKHQQLLPWKAETADFYRNGNTIRVIPGSGWPALQETSRLSFKENNFQLTPQSDRMGFRLQGPPLFSTNTQNLLSAGISRGTIQLLPNGQLIILMADHQTTGGYMRIAHIAGADLPMLSQINTGSSIYFSVIEHSLATRLLWQQQQALLVLQNACKLRLRHWSETKGLLTT